MSQPDPPSFHLRLPPSLKAQLLSARGRNSLNREIIERLERSFEPDAALQIAEMFRPFLVDIDEENRAELIELVSAAISIVSRSKRKK
jgi:hypothetical protein